MGERKGTNKYYPPDFDPKKHKSLAGYTGAHPLRERARKLHKGILIIRFEMPYNIWCDGCNNHIGMGVRYNAEKSKIGNYYTTPIWKFRMKCHLCDNHFEIKTDPAAHDYVIISGARRKEQRWDPKENEQIVTEEKSTQKKLALDAMYKLEHGVDDKTKLKKAIPGIAQIEEMQADKKDDYLLNKLAREKFRGEKKALRAVEEKDASLLQRSSLEISLLEETDEDAKMADLLKFSTVQSFDEKRQQKREQIECRPLFPPAVDTGSQSPSITPPSSQSSLQDTRKHLGISNIRQLKNNPFSSPTATKSGLTTAALGIIRKTRTPETVASPIPDNGDIQTISISNESSDISKDIEMQDNTVATDTEEYPGACRDQDSNVQSDVFHNVLGSFEELSSEGDSERTVESAPAFEKSRKNIENNRLKELSSSALSSLFSNYNSSSNSDSD